MFDLDVEIKRASVKLEELEAAQFQLQRDLQMCHSAISYERGRLELALAIRQAGVASGGQAGDLGGLDVQERGNATD